MTDPKPIDHIKSEGVSAEFQMALLPLANSRNNWDPKQSDLVERVIVDIVQLYRNGDFRDEIYPHMLVERGELFKKFYKAAFLSDSAWSKERFPEGWEGFVRELNGRLSDSGIAIINTKREAVSNTWLPDWERNVVRPLSKQVQAGEKTTEEALEILRLEFNISLPPGSVRYYFPSQGSRSEQRTLSQRKDELSSRIQELKSDFNIDLTISSCLQGLVFEKYVGVILRILDPQGSLESQRFCKISYSDLSGKDHYCVYPDWISGEKSWEVKLKNSVENILESAIPQSIALGHKQTVIYRHPCQELLFMVEENVRLDAELEAMGLMSEFLPGTRIGDFITYQSIEMLMQDIPDSHVCRETLKILDTYLAKASSKSMWEWLHAFDRIAATPDQLEAKLTILNAAMLEDRSLSHHEIQRLFGGAQTRSTAPDSSNNKLLEIITRERNSAQDRLLLSVYNAAFSGKEARLTLSMVEQLETLSAEKFAEAAVDVLASMEAASRSRTKRVGQVSAAAHEYSVIAAFEKTETRRVLDALHDADDVTERCITRVREYFDMHRSVTQESPMGPMVLDQNIHQALSKMGWQGQAIVHGLRQLNELIDRSNQTRVDCAEDCFQLIKIMWSIVNEDERYNFNAEGLVSTLRLQREATERALSGISTEINQNSLMVAIGSLADQVRKRNATLPAKSRTRVLEVSERFSAQTQERLVHVIGLVADFIEEHALAYPQIESSSYHGISAAALILHHTCLAIESSHQRGLDERIALVLNHVTRAALRINSEWKKGVSRDGQVLQALQGGALDRVVLSMADCLLEIQVSSEASYGTQSVQIPDPNSPRDDLIHWLESTPLNSNTPALGEQERIFRLLRGARWSNAVTLLWAAAEGLEIAGGSRGEDRNQNFEFTLRLSSDLQRYPQMIARDLKRYEDVLDRTWAIQGVATIDLLSRQIAQARRIAHFDYSLAVEFLREATKRVPDATSPISVLREEILASLTQSDRIYESLIGPYRWNGSLF